MLLRRAGLTASAGLSCLDYYQRDNSCVVFVIISVISYIVIMLSNVSCHAVRKAIQQKFW